MTTASSILVIDDVVTSGATLYAACLAISDANPGVKVKAFGVSRTDQSAAEFMFCKVSLLGPTGLDVLFRGLNPTVGTGAAIKPEVTAAFSDGDCGLCSSSCAEFDVSRLPLRPS